MTRMTTRLRWARAIKSTAYPAHLRSIKGTLLSLVDVMAPTGELYAWREEMAAAAGLPERTLDRHLARAVAAGWLRHEDHGGRGRRGLYIAVIPGDSAPEVARYSGQESGDSAPLTRGLSTPNSAPPGGELNKDKSTSVSEFQALGDQRRRRTAPDGSRDSRPQHAPNSSSDGDGAARLLRLAADPDAPTNKTGDNRPCA